MKDRRLLFLWPVLIIGLALIVMPFAMSMPSKVDTAQKMLDSFRPVMRAASVAKTAEHYYDSFLKLQPVAEAEQALANKVPQLAPILESVVPAVAHYKPFVDAAAANAAGFQKLDGLPSFRLLTWFFIIPGILFVLLSGVPLAMELLKRRAGATA